MNKSYLHLGAILIITVLFDSCYNNSHVRTHRVIKAGEPSISANASLNVISPSYWADRPSGSYRLEQSGISGIRAGISYLGLHKGYEQGPSINIGISEDNLVYTIGYDFRKQRYNKSGQSRHYGLYLESNNISSDYNYGVSDGSAFQIRPYIMSITSSQKAWYWGVHGLASFGTISRKDDISYYDQQTDNYIYQNIENEYKTNALGVGITVGLESRVGGLMSETQFDFSMLNQHHEWADVVLGDDDYASSFDAKGPVVSIGLAFHKAPKREPVHISNPLVSSSILPLTIQTESQKRIIGYDPFTGQEILDSSNTGIVQFDPFTGEKLQELNPPQFDPLTGLPTQTNIVSNKKSPYSLLTAQEKTNLMNNPIKVTNINGSQMDGFLLDLTDVGLSIDRGQIMGKTVPETIKYSNLWKIHFSGNKKGISGIIPGAIKTCAVCTVLPMVAGWFTGEGDMFFLGIGMSPLTLLVGGIYGASEREVFPLEFPKNATNEMFNHRRELITGFVKIHLGGGFPDYNQKALEDAIKAAKQNTGDPRP